MSSPSSNMPPQQLSALERADRLLQLHDQLNNIRGIPGNPQKGTVEGALATVQAHRTGMREDDAWDQVAYQHTRFYETLCRAVGVKSGIIDYGPQVREEAEADPNLKPLSMIVPSQAGEFFKSNSFESTCSFLALNTGPRAPIEGRNAWFMSVDPDDTGFDVAVAKKLDAETIKTLNELEKERDAFKKGTPEYDTLNNKIQALENITGKKMKLKELSLPGTRRRDESRYGFAQLVQLVDDAVGNADEDWRERRQRDRGVGILNTSRHSEENPANLALIGDFAAKHGYKIPSLLVLTGLSPARFHAIGHVTYLPESGEPQFSAQITGIPYPFPFCSKKPIMFATGQFLGLIYEPLFRGKPEMTPKTRDKIDKNKGDADHGFKVPEIDPQTGKQKLDDKNNPVWEQEKIIKRNKKGMPLTDPITGEPLYEQEIKKDAKGKIVFKPLTPEEKEDLFKNNPVPLGSIATADPNLSITILMDLIAQYTKMGGNPSHIAGFNPENIGTGEPVFDEAALSQLMQGMSEPVRATFQMKLHSGIDGYWKMAQAKVRDYVILPKIYKIAQNDEMFAVKRILVKKEGRDPADTSPITQAMKIKCEKDYPGEIEKMRKTPLDKWSISDTEKQMAIAEHNALLPEEQLRREQEIVRTRYMDTSSGTLGRGDQQTEIVDNAIPEGPEASASVESNEIELPESQENSLMNLLADELSEIVHDNERYYGVADADALLEDSERLFGVPGSPQVKSPESQIEDRERLYGVNRTGASSSPNDKTPITTPPNKTHKPS